MRNLGLCGDVLCVGSEFFVHEEHHAATTGGDGLVAVEGDGANATESACMLTLVAISSMRTG